MAVSNWLHDNAREILEIDEIRSVLESHAIHAITEWDAVDAARRTSAVLRGQREAVARQDALEASRLDAEFHLVLSSYSKNRALRSFLAELVDTSGPETLAIYSLPEVAERSLAQHQEIVDALSVSDVNRVAEIARLHLIDAAQQYSASIEEHPVLSRRAAPERGVRDRDDTPPRGNGGEHRVDYQSPTDPSA